METNMAPLIAELNQLVADLRAHVPANSVFNISHGNWSFPGLTLEDIVGPINDLIALVEHGAGGFEAVPEMVQNFTQRITFLRGNTVPQVWGSPQAAVPAIFMTLDAIKRVVGPVKETVEAPQVLQDLRHASRQLRGLQARLRNLEHGSVSMEAVFQEITAAHAAALQLPEDVESLNEIRREIYQLKIDAEKDRVAVLSAKNGAEEAQQALAAAAAEADESVKKANHAYSVATSQGLAAAFADRSQKLSWSMWAWVAGLACSLGIGSYLGKGQLMHLSELLKTPDASNSVIVLNFLLSILSVGAPIWFAWLSTKQVGQRFRLAEDYAFKASISKAYEGYRREASRIDPTLEVKLLTSALTRLDEQPLRLVETANHGSPWQDLLSSDLMKEAVRTIPNLSGQITAYVSSLVGKAKGASAPSASPTPVVPPGEAKSG
ncbi:hypothetical protein [Pseudomonas monteilii]|uniref:hypothetical protein n=1 Tax=Pseudomonas monteilii TaxID=76759 RepID=UPI0039065D47